MHSFMLNIYRQFGYAGANYLLTMSMLSSLYDSNLFFAISAVFVFNGWAGSFFINQIVNSTGVAIHRRYVFFFIGIIILFLFYVTRMIDVFSSFVFSGVLALRIVHDYKRKQVFLTSDVNETLPALGKLGAVPFIFILEDTFGVILIYMFTYFLSLLYYLLALHKSSDNSNFLSYPTTVLHDFLVLTRVSAQSFVLLALPYFYPQGSDAGEFIYWWAALSVLSVLNDLIERYAFEFNSLKYLRFEKYFIIFGVACAIIFSLKASSHLVAVLVLLRQLALGFYNFRYAFSLRTRTASGLFVIEFIKSSATLVLFFLSAFNNIKFVDLLLGFVVLDWLSLLLFRIQVYKK